MEVTIEQRFIISLIIKGKLGKLFINDNEVEEVCNLIFDDVISDIEDCADWSDLENDEVNEADVDIAISRVLYKHIFGIED